MTTATPATGELQARLNLIDYAIAYAAAGWKIHPCREKSSPGFKAKAPYLAHGLSDASYDIEKVKAWWTRWPNALIGGLVPPGAIVLDGDPRDLPEEHRANGGQSMLEYLAGGELPETLTAESGGADRGRHYWFTVRKEGLRHRGLPAGIDLREGGRAYVILPPSPHPDTGEPYRWLNQVPIAPVPTRIMALLDPPAVPAVRRARRAGGQSAGAVAGIVRVMSQAIEGQRNRTLFWCACRMEERDRDRKPTDWPALTDAALQVGLTELEITRTMQSARRTVGGNS